MLPWWTLAAALAGQLTISLPTPVVVRVDGAVVPYASDRLLAVAAGLGEGSHEIEVVDGGEVRATARIEVPTDQEVRLIYQGGELIRVGSVPLPQHGGKLADRDLLSPGDALADRDLFPELRLFPDDPADRETSAGAEARPEPEEVWPGAVLVTGLTPGGGRVLVDGVVVPWSAEAEGFATVHLAPGLHALRVEQSGRVRYDGTVNVRAELTRVCAPKLEELTWTLPCHWDPELPEVDEALDAPGGLQPALAPPPPPAPPDEEAFAALLERMVAAGLPDDQLAIVADAAVHEQFTVAQVVRLMAPLSRGRDKVRVVALVVDAVVDPENLPLLEAELTFDSDKKQLRMLFPQEMPR